MYENNVGPIQQALEINVLQMKIKNGQINC